MNAKEEITHIYCLYIYEGEDKLLVLVDHERRFEVLEGGRDDVLDDGVRQVAKPVFDLLLVGRQVLVYVVPARGDQ